MPQIDIVTFSPQVFSLFTTLLINFIIIFKYHSLVISSAFKVRFRFAHLFFTKHKFNFFFLYLSRRYAESYIYFYVGPVISLNKNMLTF